MKSPLGSLLRSRNAGKPPIPLDNGRAYRRGLAFNLGNGRQDGETFMRQYGMSGTLFGIVSLLAESAATPCWKLYKKPTQDGRVRYTTSDRGSDQRIQVVQHAAIQLWSNPNDHMSGFEFREACQQHQELTGETIWVLDMDAGFPTSMWPVRPDRMEPVPDPDNFLIGWYYTSPTGEQVPLLANEVIIEKRPDPLDPYRGAGPVASILPNIQQQRYATEYQRNLFLNGADPGGVITVPNKLSDRDFDELVDRWRESHRGVARAGQVGVLENGAMWQPGAHTNKDMEYGALRLANRDELREAWRIHKAMMGTSDDVNRANAETAEEVFISWQVIPRLNRRRDTLNSKLLPLFKGADKTYEFDYDDPSPTNAEAAANELYQKAQAAALLIGTNRFDPHDVLEVVGLPDMSVVEVQQAAATVPAATPAAFETAVDGAEQNRSRERITMLRPTAATAPPAAPPHDLSKVDAAWKKAVAAAVAAYSAKILPAQRRQLAQQAADIIDDGDFIELANLRADHTEGAKLLLAAMTAYAAVSARHAAAEAKAQGATVAPATPDDSGLSDVAEAAAALAAARLAMSAGTEAMRRALADPDADGADIADDVEEYLAELSDADLSYRISGAMSAAQNGARVATFMNGPSADLFASEVIDRSTCTPCKEIDGQYIGNTRDDNIADEIAALYPNGGYTDCAGADRCRGTVIAAYTADDSTSNRATPAIGNKDAAAKAFQQVAEDFPPAAAAWMHHATWSGPANVPLAHIDWTPEEMEGADPAHVAEFVAKLQAGKKLKPVILVKTPGAPTLRLVDGHHRYLAAAQLQEPVRAYIGVVDADHGPWEHMHSKQYKARAGPRARQPAPDLVGLARRVMADGWVPIETGGRAR